MRGALEKQFATHDGTILFYRHWPAVESIAEQRAIVLFHRGHEHSGRVQHVVDELQLPGYAMFAWDARGHGRSPGPRGDSPSFGASVRDVATFIRHIETKHGIAAEDIAIIAQSMAAVLAATWVHDYAPRVRCLVLTTPAFKVKLYVPFARAGLNLLYRLFGNFFITSYVQAKLLTHDPDRIRSYDEDPLITRAISVRILLGLFDSAARVIADAPAIRLPVQLLVSDRDWVVHHAPQERFFDQLGSALKERHLLPGFLHDILGERDRKIAIDKIRDFIERMFRDRPAQVSLRHADKMGYTYAEEQRLRKPLSLLSPRNIQFALTRLSMRTLGRLAHGIRIGLATGFDSGHSLDYVYRNEAQGALLLGRVIDRGYLNAIGWRGVRIRRQNMVTAIVTAAERLRAARSPVRIADVAAGHGRYVLEAVEQLNPRPEAVVLRDYVESNVRVGQALIEAKQLSAIARFEIADAFDEKSLAALSPKPTIAIVSGLYELFSDNDAVMRSLQGIAQAVEKNGFLLYTGQPWHPQLEMIARTLISHRDRQPWIMRRRTQAELDELVRTAGFEKSCQWIDGWGMFSVSLAVRTD